MAGTMNPSDATPITAGQIGKIQDLLAAALRKTNVSSGLTQGVIEDPIWSSRLVDGFVKVVVQYAEDYQLASQPRVLLRKFFNPEQFLGKGWKVAQRLGKRPGQYLNAAKIIGKDYLKGRESNITGKERLYRIKTSPADIQLGDDHFLALWEEEGHVTLNWLYETKNITFLSFWATILQNPDGDLCVLCLFRGNDNSWHKDVYTVVFMDWYSNLPAAVLVS